MDSVSLVQQVPVVGDYDVVVCGGGPAGFVAAVAAARGGARVALVERFGFLGGMATAALVAPISVFSYHGQRVIGGIPWEFVKRLADMGGALVEQPLNNVAFDPELYKLLAQRMVLESGVALYTNTVMTGCQIAGGRVSAVLLVNKGGAQALTARAFVDATGDADLAFKAGIPMQPQANECQPGSLIFALDGVDTDRLPSMHHNRQGVNCHDLKARERLLKGSEAVPEFGGPWFCTLLRRGRVLVNMTRRGVNALDCRDTARAECAMREDVFRLAALLRERVPEFRDSYVVQVAPAIGIRESRRILGLHTITAEEYLSAEPYPDWVSRSCHPIDVHRAGGARQDVRFLEKAAYIPYRAMVAPGFHNLVTAGRCISADRRAFASIRVQAPAMGTGQAAGVAAALAAREGLRVDEMDGVRLHELLSAQGACPEA